MDLCYLVLRKTSVRQTETQAGGWRESLSNSNVQGDGKASIKMLQLSSSSIGV